MKTLRFLMALAILGAFSAAAAGKEDWQIATPGLRYEFPRDHLPHPGFKTEWWYFTGNLRAADGRRFGYQLTFFRQGLRPPGARAAAASRFVVNDLKFAHFAITDVNGGRFSFAQKLSRGAFGEAGFNQPDPPLLKLAWIDDWQLTMKGADHFSVAAAGDDARLELQLSAAKPWAIQGENGVSQKAEGAGHASYYYSGTRLQTSGRLVRGGRAFAVTGESWFDHEWATNQLTEKQIGWNWFSMQLEDGSELMLYQMRTRDGGVDPNSSGTVIAPDGATRHLRREDYTLKPLKFWKSPQTQGRYPIGWEVAVPSLNLQLKVTAPVEKQELVLQPIAYWEGVIDVAGRRGVQPVKGHGYMELTGYAGELVGLTK